MEGSAEAAGHADRHEQLKAYTNGPPLPGDIQIHLRARCETEAEAEQLLEEVGSRIESLLGDRIYSRSGEPLEQVVGELLRQSQATLSVAESCTGGLLAERITSIPGSSDYFLGGFLV